jgi:hypothetical protein
VKGLVKLAGLLIEVAPHEVVQTLSSPLKKFGTAALVVPIIFKLTVALLLAFVVVANPVVPPLGPFGTTLVAP